MNYEFDFDQDVIMCPIYDEDGRLVEGPKLRERDNEKEKENAHRQDGAKSSR